MIKTTKAKYTLLGVLFGLCFPLIAVGIDVVSQETSFSFSNIGELFLQQPLHWLIGLAPFILGFFAYLAGIKQEEIENLHFHQLEMMAKNDRFQQNLLENAPTLILTTDCMGLITLHNRTAEELLQLAKTDWSNLEVTDLATHKSLADEAIRLSAILGSPVLPGFQVFSAALNPKVEQNEIKLELVRKDGSSFPALISVSSITDQNGRIENYMLMAMDISVLKQTEANLADTIDELQQTNFELDKFLYLASHDLRTPLRGISTLTDFIREDLGENLEEGINYQFELLKNRVVRMHLLLEGIQEYVNIGKQSSGYASEIALDDVVYRSWTMCDNPGGFTLHYSQGGPLIRFERKNLETILMHLMDNAIAHHTSSEGNVRVNWENGPRQELKVTIRDDGPGIDKKYHEKVFQVFQTLNRSEESHSIGIGLPVVKRLVEKAGGKIDMESQPGEGTALVLTFPGVIVKASDPSLKVSVE